MSNENLRDGDEVQLNGDTYIVSKNNDPELLLVRKPDDVEKIENEIEDADGIREVVRITKMPGETGGDVRADIKGPFTDGRGKIAEPTISNIREKTGRYLSAAVTMPSGLLRVWFRKQ